MTWNHLVPLTRRQVKQWLAYTGTKGASCYTCGETFNSNSQWLYLRHARLAPICAECAIHWVTGNNLVPPNFVTAFLDRHKWKSNIRGACLELMEGEAWRNSKETEAVALFKRLTSGRCDGCKEEASKVLDVAIDSRRLVVSLCQACLRSGLSAEVNLESLMVSAELANIVSRIAA